MLPAAIIVTLLSRSSPASSITIGSESRLNDPDEQMTQRMMIFKSTNSRLLYDTILCLALITNMMLELRYEIDLPDTFRRMP